MVDEARESFGDERDCEESDKSFRVCIFRSMLDKLVSEMVKTPEEVVDMLLKEVRDSIVKEYKAWKKFN